MIETILPDAVVAVEARADAAFASDGLFPAERALIGHSVQKRRREFATARACARAALARLGLPPVEIASGARGEPLWPAGVVGSITHCEGYRACALARSREILTIGIDAEPHAPLAERLLADIAGTRELRWLRRQRDTMPQVHWDRLLFSAKEAVYKAWFPLAKRWLGFEDAELEIHAAGAAATGTFTARLLVPGPPLAGRGALSELSGRWLLADGLLVSAIALRADAPGPEEAKAAQAKAAQAKAAQAKAGDATAVAVRAATEKESTRAALSPSSAGPRPSR